MNTSQPDNIFEAIRQAVPLTEYCENNGVYLHRIGRTFRADSPFTNAHNAFSINVDAQDFWHDFTDTSQHNHGDVIDFCAFLNHNGNKREALLELIEYLPEKIRELYAGKLNQIIKDKEEEQDKIRRSHEALISGKYSFCSEWIQYLHERGIDDEQIERCRIGVDLNDFRLIIPRFNHYGIEVLGHNRRKRPDAEGHENEQEPKYKYAQCDEFVRKVPLGLQTLNRKNKYLILTEGDFDYLSFERENFPVLDKVALEGRYWQEVTSNAEKRDEVILAFDSDKQGRTYTLEAAKKLFEANLPFRVIILPENCKDINDYHVEYCKNGNSLQMLIDDAEEGHEYLARSFMPDEGLEALSKSRKRELRNQLKTFLIQVKRNGADKADMMLLCEKLSEFYSQAWLNEILKLSEKEQTEFEVVEAIQKKHNLIFNERTGFYEYSDEKGIWLPCDDTAVYGFVQDYLGHSASAKKMLNVTQQLKASVNSNEPVDKFNRLPLIGFSHGTLHFSRNSAKEDFLKSPSATDFLTHRLNYDYDSDSRCEEWLKFLDRVMMHDKKRIECLQEFCGYVLLPHCKYQKALILRDKTGDGSNGKSTLLEVLRALFGHDNTSCLEPAQFANEHAIMQIKDSMINICADAKTDISGSETNLKKAICGEPLTGRYLYKPHCIFQPRAKIVFAVNGNIKTKDNSGSMMRRFLIIDFNAHFIDDEPPEGSTKEFRKDLNIAEKLMHELPGIFNWALEGANRLIRQGKFTQTDEQHELSEAFNAKKDDDSVEAFLSDYQKEFYDSDGYGKKFTRSEIYAMYADYCDEMNIEPVSSRTFHEAFRDALQKKSIQYGEHKERKKDKDTGIRKDTRVYDFLVLD